MEFSASVPIGEGFVSKWTAREIGALSPAERAGLAEAVNVFGGRSAAAQGLQTPITDFFRLAEGDQALYLAAQRPALHRLVVYGFIKVGAKALWIWPPGERCQRAAVVPCVLDFYVHETVQRSSVGLRLFEAFLADGGLTAERLAYDLPSDKCRSFLRKHYGLEGPQCLSNNYVVFPGFFRTALPPPPPAGQQASPWASIAARPLTQGGGRGRRSTGVPLSPQPRASQQPPLAPCLGSGGMALPAHSRGGSFGYGSFEAGQPPGQASWGGGACGSRGMPPVAQAPCFARRGDALPQLGQQERAALGRWGPRQPPVDSCCADAGGVLPPLHQGRRHFGRGCGASAGGAMPWQGQQQDRCEIPRKQLLPIGKAQRLGAGAGACLYSGW